MTTIQNLAAQSTANGSAPIGEPQAGFAADWRRWQTERETALALEYGWLSLTGFYWLPATPQALEGLPGRWSADAERARLDSDPGCELIVLSAEGDPVGRQPVSGTVTAEVPEAGSCNWIGNGDRVIELLKRAGRYAIRVRDPLAATRTTFAGVPTFAPDLQWVRSGRVSLFRNPQAVAVGTARDDLRQQITVVGTVTIGLPSGDQDLLVSRGADGTLQILFHDATNGQSTAPWRTVVTSVPDVGGRVCVDFNRAVNLPFAFTDFGTCPAPPDGNTIIDAVTAGEKKPLQATTDRTAHTRS